MGSNGPNFPSPRPPLVVRTTPLEDEFSVGTSVLGAGINGKVVECTDRTGKKCALKVIRDCPESRREVELQWKASSCPQVVSLLAVYQKTEYTSHSMTKKLQVVMECMEGGELFDRISIKDAFTEKEAALIMKEICLAVKHLHDMNIAHRDLKPENLLYASSEPGAQLKLGDFGFAKQTVDSVGLQSAKYTPYYAAPEVLGPVGRRYRFQMCGFTHWSSSTPGMARLAMSGRSVSSAMSFSRALPLSTRRTQDWPSPQG